MKIEEILDPGMTGLYRDDGIALVKSARRSGQQLRQKIFDFFKNYGFKVDISPVSTSVDYLDIRLHSSALKQVS